MRSVEERDVIQKAVTIMNVNDIHHVPVLNRDQLVVGILSRSDIDQALIGSSRSKKRKRKESKNINDRSEWSSEIMTKEVISLQITDSIQDAYQIFELNHFRALPILERKSLLVL